MRKNKFVRVLMMIAFACIAMLVFGLIVMSLWNAVLPAVLGVKTITFFQALGILLLSKILFGGFRPRGRFGDRCGGPGGMWKMRMKEKFQNMTPEEREKVRAAWKSRCGRGGRWHMDEDEKENEIV